MPTIGPYKISIAVNGSDLREHEPPTDERVDELAESGEKRVVYIEVVEDSNFDVRFKAHGHVPFGTGQLGVSVYLDNVLAKSKLLSEKYHSRHNRTSLHITSSKFLQDGGWVERPFVFSNLATTDAETSTADLKKIAQNVGTIRVRLENMTTPTQSMPTRGTKDQIQEIPEKALKGQPIDLAAGFGDPRPTGVPSRWKSKAIGDPLLECVFKYRSKKALQMLDLIPLTPEPVPLHAIDPNTFDLAEARELLSQIQAQGNQPESIKQESVRIKEERDVKERTGSQGLHSRKREASVMDASNEEDDDVIFVEAKRVRSVPSREIEVFDLS